MSEPDLRTENAALRARVEALERKLYPPPPAPKEPDDPNRYILLPRELRETDDAWVRFHRLPAEWAMEHARESHPKLRWHFAYGWGEIPEHGQYATYAAILWAKHDDKPIVLCQIDDRQPALDAIMAQSKRLSLREDELIEAVRNMSLAEHRVWAHRWHILGQAHKECRRAHATACHPLTDYSGVMRAATTIVDEALAAAGADIRIEDVPGYLPGGWWECEDCGYPYPDSEARKGGDVSSCCACRVADPRAAGWHAQRVEEFRAKGEEDIADKLDQAWRDAVEHAATVLHVSPARTSVTQS